MDTYQKIKIKLNSLQETPTVFWFALILLNTLLLLPAMVFYPGSSQFFPIPPLNTPRGCYDTLAFFFRRENQDFFRIAVDYYIILTTIFFFGQVKWSTLLRRILLSIYLFLLIYSAYDAAMFLIFGEHPILYNDILLLLGAVYLIIDISFTKMFLGIAAIIITLVAVFLFIPYLFRTVYDGLIKRRHSKKILLSGIFIWLFIGAMTFWFRFQDYRSITRWITPKLFANISESMKVRDFLNTIKSEPIDSTYYHYPKVELLNPPNIYLIMVESYGKILTDDEDLIKLYQEHIGQFSDSLQHHNIHAASNFSLSPIFGGRSWLSVGTVINGIKIKDQAVYSYLINRVKDYPSLVYFLKGEGYQTYSLQPLNRVRPGYKLNNYERFYQYDTYINFQDLDFDGPAFGFRNVPDQYSLNYAHQKFLKASDKPFFLFFMTVSSHSPWIDLPPYPKDWHDLKNLSTAHIEKRYGETKEKIRETLSSHYASGFATINYAKHIFYELDFLRDFILHQAKPNDIFVILGDHQPPLVMEQKINFYTPIHVISGDSTFIRQFKEFGFRGGFSFPTDSTNFINHEGIYSMLARTLTLRYGETDPDSLPAYQPKGVPLSIVR